MNRWIIVRLLFFSLVALTFSNRTIFADSNACDVCSEVLANFHACDGCTITTLGSCQWTNIEQNEANCLRPSCVCVSDRDRGCGGPYI